MKREVYKDITHEEWLTLRGRDITSTQTAALFDCSPFNSEWEIYQLKRDLIESSFIENDRIKWGNRLEEAIGFGIAEDLGLTVELFKPYIRLPELRIGSSFDFLITGLTDGFDGDETYRDLFREHGQGLMEIKNVDGLVFKKNWIDKDGAIEAPPHIELQIQHQMLVSGYAWCVGAPLVGGNNTKPFYRFHDSEMTEAIKEVVADFWEKFDSGYSPEPNFSRDAQAVISMHKETSDEKVDMSSNDKLEMLCYEYELASNDELEASKRKEAARAEILTIIGNNKEVVTGSHRVVTSEIKDTPPQIITQSMVGKEFGGREGHRRFAINKRLI